MEYITHTWYCDTAIKSKLLKKCWHGKEHLKNQRSTSCTDMWYVYAEHCSVWKKIIQFEVCYRRIMLHVGTCTWDMT